MHGKLNGVMPATTPSGWRSVQLSMPVETWSVKSPFSSCGMPQANSTMSMPRGHLALGVGEHLAVLGGDHRGQRVAVLVHQFEEFVQHARAADGRGVGPGRLRGRSRSDGRVHLVDAGERHLARDRAGGRVPHRLAAPAG